MQLEDFLVNAKKSTYANPDQKPVLLEDGKKKYAFSDQGYTYEDIYTTRNESFYGTETVKHYDIPVWRMEYTGRIVTNLLPQDQVYAFLKKALHNVEKNIPFRGPKEFSGGMMQYTHTLLSADTTTFKGIEEIFVGKTKVYELKYCGEWLERKK
ncbi:MAG: DUF5680 domain-containing protein [Candidatus Woesearchaeota archaeon]